MTISKDRLLMSALVAVLLVVVQVALMVNSSSVYAFTKTRQIPRSYFENSQPILPWTGSTSLPTGSGQCVNNLQGYVIPNNTLKDPSKGPGRECDGTGAVGDTRMYDVTKNPSIFNDRREGFYQILYYDYYSGNAWEKAGASQVALSLLGYGFGSGHGRNISPAEWTDLHYRITAPDVEIMWTSTQCAAGSTWCISGGAPFRYNTAGVVANGQYDAIRVDNNGNGATNVDAWVFRSKSNPARVYGMFEIECGNGIGDIAGLPIYVPTYNLQPSITGVNPNPAEAGTRVTVTSQINYSGDTSTPPTTQWQINQIVIKNPGGAQPSSRGGGTSAPEVTPCIFYGKPPVDCNELAKGNGAYSGSVALPAQTSPPLDYPVGTEICYGLSVQPRSFNSDEWVHSALVCTVIGIKPKVQIWGGDLFVGRPYASVGYTGQNSYVNTGVSAKQNGTFGSWVEYGIIAPSMIQMASGAGLAKGNNGASDPTVLSKFNANQLTFANTGGTGSCAYGCFNGKDNLGAIPDVASKYISSTTATTPGNGATIDFGSLATGVHAYTGNVAIAKTTLPPGKWLVVKASGTITITGDIQYDNNALLKSSSDIPQLILIADKIKINEDVKNVDSWLVAKSSGVQNTGGIIDTCAINDNYATPLDATKCNQQLTINGPVMAERLWLRRTGGSGTGGQSGDPAEIMNLRADAYLWASTQAAGNGRIQTVYTKDMAPRF